MLQYVKRSYTRLVEWTLQIARGKYGTYALAADSFAESSFFIVPPDILLIALCSARKGLGYLRLAAVTTISSVLGGLFGYLIGATLFVYIGQSIVDMYGLHAEMESVRLAFQNNAFLAILTAAFTPIPYKIFTISAGLFSVNIWVFIIASLIGRGTRFYLVAYLTHKFELHAKEVLIKHVNSISMVVIGVVLLLAIVIGVFK